LCAALLVAILHWPQALALFAMGAERPDFSVGPKQGPRWPGLLPPLALFAPPSIIAYREEFRRGWITRSTRAFRK